MQELIQAAAALVMNCCTGDSDGLLGCNFCQRVSELGRPIVHVPHCPVGRVQRAAVAVTKARNAAILRPTASWDHGDVASANMFVPPQGEEAAVRVEPDPDRGRHRAICGHRIPVFGLGDGVLTCALAPGHGDAWHEDESLDIKWPNDCFSVVLHATGSLEYRRMGADSFFVHLQPRAAKKLRGESEVAR